MRWYVELAGREHVVSVEPRPDGSLAVSVGDRPVRVHAEAHGPRELTVHVDDRVVDLTLEGALPELGVVAQGRSGVARVYNDRSRAALKDAAASGGGKERDVRSPMPGRVIKVLVKEGDAIGPGQAVVIVEAMKMENEVRAKKGGVVARVHFAAGATVDTNSVLVSFAV